MPKRKQYHHGDLKNALIEAGIELLAQEGLYALSLRKVALKAGVSHAAPYAHFPDKQALIAAISTEGFRRLYANLEAAAHQAGDPLSQLNEGAWAYTEFALNNPDTFKIMFSSVLEKEKDYPALVEMTRRTFDLVVEIVKANQAAGSLRPGPPDLLAVGIWSAVYGLSTLLVEGQVSHTVTDAYSARQIVAHTLEQFRCQPG